MIPLLLLLLASPPASAETIEAKIGRCCVIKGAFQVLFCSEADAFRPPFGAQYREGLQKCEDLPALTANLIQLRTKVNYERNAAERLYNAKVSLVDGIIKMFPDAFKAYVDFTWPMLHSLCLQVRGSAIDCVKPKTGADLVDGHFDPGPYNKLVATLDKEINQKQGFLTGSCKRLCDHYVRQSFGGGGGTLPLTNLPATKPGAAVPPPASDPVLAVSCVGPNASGAMSFKVKTSELSKTLFYSVSCHGNKGSWQNGKSGKPGSDGWFEIATSSTPVATAVTDCKAAVQVGSRTIYSPVKNCTRPQAID